jgi:SPP1 family predicted phage head-tail adaptor
MKVGRLRHRLQLQRRVDGDGDDGEVVPAYKSIAEVLGSVEPLSGREYLAAQQIQADTSHRITIRWRDDIEAATRIRRSVTVSGRRRWEVYDVVAPLADPIINRRWISLMCVKRESEGWRSGG